MPPMPASEIRLTVEQHLRSSSPDELVRQAAHFSDVFITRRMLDAIPGIVMVLNQNRQIVFASQNLASMLGLSGPESLVGKRPGDVMDCRSALEAEHGCGSGESCTTCGALAAIMSGLDGREDVQECLLTRQREDCRDEPLTLRVWSSPLEFESDRFTVLSGIDISHERRRHALERTFFHDILNLVGSIRGFAELMQLQEDADPAELSQLIQNAAQRVINEIDSQRMLLAAERHELQVNYQQVDSQQFLCDFARLFQSQDLARGRELVVEHVGESQMLIIDDVILGRILGNMVKNALEASLTGEVIRLGSHGADASVTFTVHNREVIPLHTQSRIFQKDFSTKGRGRGLGTYGMKLLASFLNAEVTFTSTADTGTTFSLTVPVRPVQKPSISLVSSGS